MQGQVQGQGQAAPRVRVAVVGAGWAGLAAAVRLAEQGRHVTLFEMAAQFGGRARSVRVDAGHAGQTGEAGNGNGNGPGAGATEGTEVGAGLVLDNGQHILIGAYTRTLALMATVGADAQVLLHRMPLVLRHADGRGLQSPGGPPLLAFVRAVAGCVGWNWRERLALLFAASGWALRGFRCAPGLSVDELCRSLPPAVRTLLIDPLCIAALNTPPAQASAAVLLRVLHDALFSGRGSADLLLPRRPLGELLPQPAARWLVQAGAELRPATRVQWLERAAPGWRVDAEFFDHVVLACSAAEAARLATPIAPDWAARAAALRYEPIITVYLRCPGARLATPMMALADDTHAPAQFAFDHGALGGAPGVFAFSISGASAWLERGLPAAGAAVLQQARTLLPHASLLRTLAEKRATFACTPKLQRPPAVIAPGLVAAGDYVEGPYPATLEGAVRAGEAAAERMR